MFTPGGQIDHLSFAGLRGGGKGGGGGGSAPANTVLTDPVSGKTFVQGPFDSMLGPSSAQNQLNAEIDARQAGEKATSDAATAKAAQDAATGESTFQTNRQNAYNDALQSTIRSFQLQGVDPANYMSSDIQPALQRQFNSIQDLDPNPSAAFPTSLGDTIVNSVLTGKRTGATNALNQVFTPNYANNLIPDSLTGTASNDILNEQFNPLMDQLGNAQRRGTLTSSGYQAALDALNQKKSAAQSTLNTLGAGIISNDRSSINDIISGAKTDASGLSLAGNFDPSTYAGQAGTKAQSELG
ncbi:MAG TPA: hypothetical protein VGN34_09135, partial [Ktedonobacteraceae bacterium]